ncbi:hypothetical protein DV711_06165 [Motiliproteus coralliicola]|uniref:Uncharacterized protein n=1 Tax=Motiliproteus coralliicola TaxID=2283196 RepID=A0A369WTZ4_9GAMM|nr:hypothetical protein [Motiliproteus coralliicola]RDE25137.1 hypothetical protein DV711_06165 [Motiliproteus coralliicola]
MTTTVTQQKIIDGLLEDDKEVNRNVANAVSQLKAQTDLMLGITAYLFTEVLDENSPVDVDHIANVSQRFQNQLVPLLTDILPKLQAIEACGALDADGNPDATARATNLANMVSTYSLDPATFDTRYKS